jgi:DNA-directed RNA polymerase specialized sigma24 family protein
MIAQWRRFERLLTRARRPAAAQPPAGQPPPAGPRERRRLQAVVDQLPADTRRVFTLRKVYDLSVPDIAARLGLSVHEVEEHLVAAVLAFARAAPPRVVDER